MITNEACNCLLVVCCLQPIGPHLSPPDSTPWRARHSFTRLAFALCDITRSPGELLTDGRLVRASAQLLLSWALARCPPGWGIARSSQCAGPRQRADNAVHRPPERILPCRRLRLLQNIQDHRRVVYHLAVACWATSDNECSFHGH